MWSPRSSSSDLAAALAALLVTTIPSRASGQACCAGGSVVTPARLAMREDALVGVELKASSVLGTYDTSGRYLPQLAGDSEVDREEDVFAALRVLRRGQLAVLVPFVQTLRQTPRQGQAGGGIGDVNASARYDLVRVGESSWLPGVALLAGVTIPTGRAAESASGPLLADATGIGAWQINGALALEQTYGSWLVNATGIVAARTEHAGETLAPQVTLLAAGAYILPDDSAVALSVSYALEGSATCPPGVGPCPAGSRVAPESAKGVMNVGLTAVWPFHDDWRLHLGFSCAPPVSSFGYNQPAVAGVTLGLVRSWS